MMSPSSPRLDPVAGAAALVTRVALAFLLIGAPLASVATRQAVYTIVPIGTVLTLVAWLMEPDMRGPGRLRHALLSLAGLGALFFFAWTALSLTWTPFAVGPSERFVKTTATLTLVAIAIAFLSERTKTSNLYLLPIGAMAGASAMVVAALLRWSPPIPAGEYSVLDRAALGLILLFWPGVAGLLARRKNGWAAALSAVTFCAVAAVGTLLALIALVLSAATFVLARHGAARIARAASGIWAALILLSPLLVVVLSRLAPASMLSRWGQPILAWGDIVAKDGWRTLLGHGFDSAARAVAAGYLPRNVPHSFLFEVWFELGVVGAMASAFIVACAFRFAGAAPSPIAPSLLAGLLAALIVSAFGVGTAPIWWVTFLALDGLAFALVLRAQFKGRRPSARDIGGEGRTLNDGARSVSSGGLRVRTPRTRPARSDAARRRALASI